MNYKERDIELMKSTRRLKLSTIEILEHFFVVFFLSFIPLITSYDLFKIFIGTYDGMRSASELIVAQVPFLAIAVVALINQRRRLRFRTIKLRHNQEQFNEAVRRTSQSLGWTVETNRPDFFRAFRSWNWTSSWGEMITIIRTGDKLLLNSISDLNQRPTFSSFGMDKKNLNVFLSHLEEVTRGIPENTRYEEEEARKWYAKKYMRYLAYFCSLGILALGVFLIKETCFLALKNKRGGVY